MGARYMCGTLDIGDTRFNDVPFVPSQDCLHWESCQEEAYKQGREDQGELNTDTVREIRELVYQQGIEKGRADMVDKLLSICGSYPNHNDCLECSFAIWVDNEWNGCAIEQLKEQKQ